MSPGLPSREAPTQADPLLDLTALTLDSDDFGLFGIEPRFELQVPLLDDTWRRLQAQVHPDRFVQSDDASARKAMQWSMRINQAYRRLRDPVSRAAYLCELRGVTMEGNRATLPPAFLMQQMQWREALAQAGSSHEVEALEAEVRTAASSLTTQLRAQLDEHSDLAQGAAEAAQTVQRLMFLSKFQQDIDRKMDALQL